MSKLKQMFTNRGSMAAYALISATFTMLPEDVFKFGLIQCDWSWTIIVIINRILACIAIFVIANAIYHLYKKNRTSVTISGNDFFISIEYGDLIEKKGGKTVINFDECYSTSVGEKPGEIKPTSICGQYLTKFPTNDVKKTIKLANVEPIGESLYKNRKKYQLGTIVPKDDFLLMAFTELDKDGLSTMSYRKYLECLEFFWKQIDKYHGTDDVYIPILGSKITRFNRELSQQDLLDVMISSYLLSPYKLKLPYTLHVVCHERKGFSLNNIRGIDQNMNL